MVWMGVITVVVMVVTIVCIIKWMMVMEAPLWRHPGFCCCDSGRCSSRKLCSGGGKARPMAGRSVPSDSFPIIPVVSLQPTAVWVSCSAPWFGLTISDHRLGLGHSEELPVADTYLYKESGCGFT